MRRMRLGGFTLVELVVVMGIAAALVAITVPIALNITNANRGMSCSSRLQHLGQAIKLYTLDECGPPPYFPDANGDMPEDLVPPPPRWGLQTVVDSGYLKGDHALHCPADRQGTMDSPWYAHSYDCIDPDATAVGTEYGIINQHKYMSCRGVRLGTLDPDLQRQLSPLPRGGGVIPWVSRDWRPDDTTLVCWCNYHYRTIRKGGEGQYQALFWDGSVRKMNGSLFRRPTVDAWRVRSSEDPAMP